MKLLFLGGTQFVGRAMVAEALRRGHAVSLFTRGQTNPDLFPQAERILGDRDGNLAPLEGRRWDMVVDVSGYLPRLVRASAALLAEAVDRYVFISTGAVYDVKKMKPRAGEESPLVEIEDPLTEDYSGPAYGWLKLMCEQAVEASFPGRALILRPGVVAGPHDHTDRVSYWVRRVAQGGEVLVPTRPDLPIQFIDSRDLATFTLDCIERRMTGVYNTIGNSQRWDCFLDACQAASRSQATFTFIDDEAFISQALEQAGKPAGAFPMVLPLETAYLWSRTSDRALAEGLVYRSTLNTARDILAWDRTRPAESALSFGLSPADEQAVLARWKRGMRQG